MEVGKVNLWRALAVSYGIAGAFGGAAGGVAVSNDGGKSFKNFPCDALDADHPVRFGAFPSSDTWYVSAGQPTSEGLRRVMRRACSSKA